MKSSVMERATTVPQPKYSHTIQQAMDVEIGFNCTPDLPQLRYGGPHMVFMWDSLRLNSRPDLMKNLGLEATKDVMIESFSSLLCARTIPVVNIAENNKNGKGYYLMSPGDWRDDLNDTHKSIFADAPPMNVAGRLMSMSTNAVRALDRFYGNTMACERRRMKVWRSNARRDDNIVEAWVYVTRPRQLFKWNPHTNEYRFPSSFICRPIGKTYAAGHQRYEVPAVIVG